MCHNRGLRQTPAPSGEGKFRVGDRANTLGRWTLRLQVAKAKGNLGNTTRPFGLRIKQHPAAPPPRQTTATTPAPTACTSCSGGSPILPVDRTPRGTHTQPLRLGSNRLPFPGRAPLNLADLDLATIVRRALPR
jgi:hypothetical protein